MKRLANLTAVTGGIGAGKSVVCRALRAMGMEVYDCDSEARRIMDSDEALKRRIDREVAPGSIDAEGRIDRRRLGAAVFGDPGKLARLNALVHTAVLDDLTAWHAARAASGQPLFVESAILYQSGLDRLVDEVWEVTAPEETRVKRVMARNGMNEDEVRARIEAQAFTPERVHAKVREIRNDGRTPMVPRIIELLAEKNAASTEQ